MLPNVFLIDVFGYAEKGVIAAQILKFEKSVVIDPGPVRGAQTLIAELKRLNVAPNYIAPTHVHIDHAGGSATLAKEFGAKIIVHPKGAKHIANPEKLWEASKAVLGEVAEIYGKPEPIEDSALIVVEDAQKFDLGGDVLTVFHAPGHAPHMLVYFLDDARILFPADAVGMYFDGHLIPLTPPPFNLEMALRTLERLESLRAEHVVFTHYGVADGDIVKYAKEKLLNWFEVAREVAAEGGSAEDLVERLKREDDDVKVFFEKFRGKPVAISFVYTAARGLIDAAGRHEG